MAIARALANDPRIILADEPTGDLDTASGDEVIDLLVQLNRQQGTTVLIVTHDRRVARATQRILTMRDGRIVDEHPVADPLTEDLRSLARSELGRRLIQGDVSGLQRFPFFVEEGRLTPWAMELSTVLRNLQ